MNNYNITNFLSDLEVLEKNNLFLIKEELNSKFDIRKDILSKRFSKKDFDSIKNVSVRLDDLIDIDIEDPSICNFVFNRLISKYPEFKNTLRTGRKSKNVSHILVRVKDLDSEFKSIMYKNPEKKSNFIEFRTGNNIKTTILGQTKSENLKLFGKEIIELSNEQFMHIKDNIVESIYDKYISEGYKSTKEFQDFKSNSYQKPKKTIDSVPSKEVVLKDRNYDSSIKSYITYLTNKEAAIEGQGGSNTLFSAVCAGFSFGLNANDILNLIKTYYNKKCLPPWSNSEIWHKIKDASKLNIPILEHSQDFVSRETTKMESIACSKSNVSRETNVSQENVSQENVSRETLKKDENSSRFRIEPVKDVWPLPKVNEDDYICKDYGIKKRSAPTMIVGTSASGKTWHALDFCVSSVLGKKWMDKSEVKESKILYLSYEDSNEDIKYRIGQLVGVYANQYTKEELNEKTSNIHVCDNFLKLNQLETFDVLLQVSKGYDVIVIDTYKAANAKDENNSSFREELDKLKDISLINNLAVIVVHHSSTKKDIESEDQLKEPNYMRGASSLFDALGCCINIYSQTSEIRDGEDLHFRTDIFVYHTKVKSALNAKQPKASKHVYTRVINDDFSIRIKGLHDPNSMSKREREDFGLLELWSDIILKEKKIKN